jgi:hypothetical protein
MLGSIIGGVASIGGALLGAKSSSKANSQNAAIAARNYELDKQALELAEKQYADSLLGFSDSFGNRTFFEDGRGWVSQSPISTVDRRMAEGGAADQLLAELMSINRRDPETIRRERDLAATAGFNTAWDDTTNSTLITAMRAGPGTLGRTGEKLATSRGKALADILQANASGAYGQSFNEQASARAPIADLYAMMAGRAEGYNNVPSSAFGAQQGMNSASMAANARAGTNQPYVSPDNSWANALQSVGSIVSSGVNNYQMLNQQSQINNAFLEAMRSRTAGNQL